MSYAEQVHTKICSYNKSKFFTNFSKRVFFETFENFSNPGHLKGLGRQGSNFPHGPKNLFKMTGIFSLRRNLDLGHLKGLGLKPGFRRFR